MKQAIFFMLDQYADWEGAYLASQLNQADDWKVSTASINSEVTSIGGFKTLVDYQLEDLPTEFELLVLIGGNSWSWDDPRFSQLLKQRFERQKPVAAICGAVDYLARNGFLNDYLHTGNSQAMWQDYLKYNNENDFVDQQAVVDRNLVTANGTGTLDFTRLVLKLIHFTAPETIDLAIDLHQLGFYEYVKAYGNPYA